MNIAKFQPETVASFLKRRKITMLGEIGEAIGNASDRTVFRKLSQLEYLSSYSHRGKFYTLRSIAKFTSEGLWSLRSVWFSRFGTLLETAAAWVHHSVRHGRNPAAAYPPLLQDRPVVLWVCSPESRHALLGDCSRAVR
jgi:hypothetical protein